MLNPMADIPEGVEVLIWAEHRQDGSEGWWIDAKGPDEVFTEEVLVSERGKRRTYETREHSRTEQWKYGYGWSGKGWLPLPTGYPSRDDPEQEP